MLYKLTLCGKAFKGFYYIFKKSIIYTFQCSLYIVFIFQHILQNFFTEDDWTEIVNECDPSYVPEDERLGLRTVHIFGLANVLKRPIILYDSIEFLKKPGDYSGKLILY